MVDGPAESGHATGVHGSVIRKARMKVDVSAAQVESVARRPRFGYRQRSIHVS
jgi:hypothetical protein